MVETIEKMEDEIDYLHSLKENIEKEILSIDPWGNFTPDNIIRLQEIGINIKFYSLNKSKFEKMDKDNLRIEIISQVKNIVYFVIIYREDEEIKHINANEEKIPIKELNSLKKQLDDLLIEIKNKENSLAEYTTYMDVINEELLRTEDQLSYFITDASLVPEVEGKVLIIIGWIPKKKQEAVKNFLKKEDVYYLIENPKRTDNIPILLKNNFFARLFEPITKMHSLPNYFEVDPTPFFAPFFAAFFGLCLADVGYGLILLVAILAALIFVKNKKIKPIILLGLVISITTIAGGFILDTFFGTKISESSILPAALKKGIIYSDMYEAMGFALILGILQVFLGFILQAVNRYKRYGFFGFFQPFSVILLISGLIIIVMPFLAGILGTKLPDLNSGPIKIGYWISLIPDEKLFGFNRYAMILCITGLLLLLLFNNLESRIFFRPLRGLWELYGIITGVPGDILSYIRLFALGLAGALLGNAFNKIAFMLKDAIPILPLAYLGMALIMIVGHGLNMALAALSAFVHPLRLILLEFYKSVGFEGGGLAYSPFKNRILTKKNKEN